MTDGAEIAFVDKDAPVSAEVSPRGKQVMRYKVEHVFEPVKG
jgi:hypothetical protein